MIKFIVQTFLVLIVITGCMVWYSSTIEEETEKNLVITEVTKTAEKYAIAKAINQAIEFNKTKKVIETKIVKNNNLIDQFNSLRPALKIIYVFFALLILDIIIPKPWANTSAQRFPIIHICYKSLTILTVFIVVSVIIDTVSKDN